MVGCRTWWPSSVESFWGGSRSLSSYWNILCQSGEWVFISGADSNQVFV